MKRNVGNTDKLVRYVVALAILSLYYFKIVDGTLGLVVIAVAFVFAITGLLGFCPLYLLFGINTCKKKKGETEYEEVE